MSLKIQSPPSRGAWIEMCHKWAGSRLANTRSPPSRGAWIEIIMEDDGSYVAPSPPSRGAWIEMKPKNHTRNGV